MHKSANPEIVEFIDRLAEAGSHYRMDEMEDLYTADLGFLVLAQDGTISRFSKAEMFAEFRARRDAGEKPLSTEKKILHIEEQGDDATAVLYRRMSDSASPAFYELRLSRADGKWRVKGETVLPWPNLDTAKGFLPPRQNQL
jgi:hypothetical protein